MVNRGDFCDVFRNTLYSKQNPDDTLSMPTKNVLPTHGRLRVRRDDPWRYMAIQSLKGKQHRYGPPGLGLPFIQ